MGVDMYMQTISLVNFNKMLFTSHIKKNLEIDVFF